MINLKNDVYITGFDDEQAAFSEFERLTQLANEIIYAGKTLDITEEIAENIAYKGELCEYYWNEILDDYDKTITAKESIQSACSKEYCIIFKK